MNKPRKKLEIKKEHEKARAIEYQKSLVRAKQQAKREDLGPRKRKELTVLLDFLTLPPRRYMLRCAEEYRPRSYNLGRQVIGLVDHLFGRYPAPAFLYQPVLRGDNRLVDQRYVYPGYGCKERVLHRDWLLAVLRGESLAKKMKDVLTKKEVHWFLRAPAENTVQENLFWAKCATAGIPGTMCQFLVENLWTPDCERMMAARLADILRFYATYQQNLRGYELRNMTDYVRAVIQNRNFSFKGRTYGSMVKLAHDWHRTSYVGVIHERLSWKASFTKVWETMHEGCHVRFIELTNNRGLAEEGHKQRHCVFLYSRSCESGHTAIVSMRFTMDHRETRRLTIEVNLQKRSVVQVRGFANREPMDSELKLIRKWAGEHGIAVDSW